MALGGNSRNTLWTNLQVQKGIFKDAGTCIKMSVPVSLMMQTPVSLKIQVLVKQEFTVETCPFADILTVPAV